MAGDTNIEWATKVWNPLAGCSVVSPGCTNCYAMKMAARIEAMAAGRGQTSSYDGLTRRTKGGAVWTGEMRLIEDALLLSLRWKKPERIFVNSMSDLFHEDVPDEWIDRILAVAALTPQHTYMILTKRSGRMRRYMTGIEEGGVFHEGLRDAMIEGATQALYAKLHPGEDPSLWLAVSLPLPNVWLVVSTEDQTRADERIPDLLATPAAIRGVSAEPLLDGLNLRRWLAVDWQCSRCKEFFTGRHMPSCPSCGQLGGWTGSHAFNGRRYPPTGAVPSQRGSGLDLVIVGGESGPKARPCWTPDVRSVVRQCERAFTPVFVKQLGTNVRDRNDAGFEGCEPTEWPDGDIDRIEHDVDGFREDHQGAPVRIRLASRKGGDPSEWPVDLRVRQLPQPITNGAA